MLSSRQSSYINGQLKRSYALRIKSRSADSPAHSLKQSVIAFQASKSNVSSQPNDSSIGKDVTVTLLDQIKQGVRLHPVNFKPSPESKEASDQPTTLAELLAQVLKRRNMVMQQSDDESELSSIESQPEAYESIEYERGGLLEAAARGIEQVQELSGDYQYEQDGIIDLIVRL